MLLILFSGPKIMEASWWSGLPLRRKDLILPEDSIPKEPNAKFMFVPFQRVYSISLDSARKLVGPKFLFTPGVGFYAGCEIVKEGEGYRKKCYVFPKLDSLVIYLRTQEDYCKLAYGTAIHMENGEFITWYTPQVRLRRKGEWERVAISLDSILRPSYLFRHIEGMMFYVGPVNGLGGIVDSCASFEVGPIYLK